MKTIFEQLTEEHDEASSLIDQLSDTSGSDVEVRQRLFPRLQHMLLAHAHAEQKEFYPRVRDLNESVESEINDDLQEHQAMEEILNELAGIPYDHDRWSRKLDELRECVEHHVDDEESELFPEVEEYFTEEEAKEIGELYRAEKEAQLAMLVGGDEYEEMTKQELYERAKELDIDGRSRMTKEELIEELRHHH